MPSLRWSYLSASLVVALVWLHGLAAEPWAQVPFDDLASWMSRTPGDVALLAVLRLVALAVGWWCVGSAIAYAAVVIAGAPRAIFTATRRLTLPVVRRGVDAALATAVAGVLVARPAVAAPPIPPQPPSTGATIDVSPPGVPPPRPDHEARNGRMTEDRSRPRDRAPRVHVVAAGDTLWTIAHDTVAAATGRHDVTAVDPYWRLVLSRNASRLRSGDADLIHPGERILLPPVG